MRRLILNRLGFTIIELLAAIAIIGIISGTVIYNLRSLTVPIDIVAKEYVSVLKVVRAKAINNNMFYVVTQPTAGGPLQFRYSPANCTLAATSTIDYSIKFIPSVPVVIDTGTTVPLCFTPRGTTRDSVLDNSIYLVSDPTQYRVIEIFVGGGVRILPN